MKLFDHVDEIASDDECFVCILIDEVESIASSRATASAGNVYVNSVLSVWDVEYGLA